jgi:hypothetical protein
MRQCLTGKNKVVLMMLAVWMDSFIVQEDGFLLGLSSR